MQSKLALLLLLATCLCVSLTLGAKPRKIVVVEDENGNKVYPWEKDESFNYGFDDTPVDGQPGDPSMEDFFAPELQRWLDEQDLKDRTPNSDQEDRAEAQERLKAAFAAYTKASRSAKRWEARWKKARDDFEEARLQAEEPANKDNAIVAERFAATRTKFENMEIRKKAAQQKLEAAELDVQKKRDELAEYFRITGCRDFPCPNPNHDCILNPNGTFPFRVCGRPCVNEGQDPNRCGRHQLCFVNREYGNGGGACNPICDFNTCKGNTDGKTRCIVQDWQPVCVNPCTHESYDGHKVCVSQGLACEPTHSWKNFNYRCVNLCTEKHCVGNVKDSHCVMDNGDPVCVDPCEKVCKGNQICDTWQETNGGVEKTRFKCRRACPKMWYDNPCRDNPVKTRCEGIDHKTVCVHPCFKHNCDPAFQRCVPHKTKKGKFACENL